MTQELALLVDFGSTFTKLRVVELGSGRLCASSQAPSTVGSDVNSGLDDAHAALPEAYRLPYDAFVTAASSSAAGGLRIVAVGLVRDLTVKAAESSALSAGAKVVSVYANGLTSADVAEIVETDPDIVLLAGGTDGGDVETITRNARLLAGSSLDCTVVVAGNRNATDEISQLFAEAGKPYRVAPNVLPSLDRIEAAPVAEVIRELFMAQITRAKGLDRAESRIGRVTKPTPQAVLRAVELLSTGTDELPGWGELLCVDVGGATTDVYSVAEGRPSDASTVLQGLPDPVSKRTVEADLGMRVTAQSLLEAAADADLGVPGDKVERQAIGMMVDRFAREPGTLPASDLELEVDRRLGLIAVRTAVRRHAGTLERAYSPHGEIFLQRGKDLRDLGVIIGTGGILRSSTLAASASILSAALADGSRPLDLLPRHASLVVDAEYVLFAAGLLAELDQHAALRLIDSTLTRVGIED